MALTHRHYLMFSFSLHYHQIKSYHIYFRQLGPYSKQALRGKGER